MSIYRNGWTRETVLERLKERLPKNGYRCTKLDGKCAYREYPSDPTSDCCAAGAFIPDDVYRPEMEDGGEIVGTLALRYPEIEKHMPLDLDLMGTVQEAHDMLSRGGDTVLHRVRNVLLELEEQDRNGDFEHTRTTGEEVGS